MAGASDLLLPPHSANTAARVQHEGIADAGANEHAYHSRDEGALEDIIMTPTSGLELRVASGHILKAYGKGTMRVMEHLPASQRTAHLFSELASGSLVAVGKLAQLGHVVTYNKAGVTVTREDTGERVLHGPYDKERRLYYLDLEPVEAQAFALWESDATKEPIATASANLAITHTSDAAFVRFWHKVFGSPVVSTWCKAIDAGYLSFVKRLTAALVRKHDPVTGNTHNLASMFLSMEFRFGIGGKPHIPNLDIQFHSYAFTSTFTL